MLALWICNRERMLADKVKDRQYHHRELQKTRFPSLLIGSTVGIQQLSPIRLGMDYK